MRVVLVLGTSTGGIGQHVRSLAAGLVAAGDDVLVAGPASTQRRFGFDTVGALFAGLEVGTTPRPRHDLVAARRLRELVIGRDVVHAHGLRAGFLAVLALRGTGASGSGRPALVVTWHNAVLGRGPRRQVLVALERVVARGADVTLGASSDLVARAAGLGARDARLGPVAAPPLSLPARSRDDVRADLLDAAGIDDLRTPVVLAVGRLAEQKDYPTLLAAVGDHWPAGLLRPLLVVAGEGPLGEGLQRTIHERGLRVLLLGQRRDVPDLLAAADLYVLSSRWEARALVVQEAARAGVAVVATAVGGIPDLVEGAAVLVPPGDPAALAEALARLVSDPEQRERVATAVRRRSASWPDEAATTRQVRAVYAGLLAGVD